MNSANPFKLSSQANTFLETDLSQADTSFTFVSPWKTIKIATTQASFLELLLRKLTVNLPQELEQLRNVALQIVGLEKGALEAFAQLSR